MVQNKQKSNKINIMTLITCFMLIMVFVFGCIQYAFASTYTDTYVYGEDSYSLLGIADSHIMLGCFRNNTRYDTYFFTNVNGRAALLREKVGNEYIYYAYTESAEIGKTYLYDFCSFPKDGKYFSDVGMRVGSWETTSLKKMSLGGYNIENGEFISAGVPVFESFDDLNAYLNTGEVNNPIYQPKENIEYDSDIEVPLNLDIRLNGNSDFVPNVKISCNQTEQIENRYLEVQYSIGYKATWKLLGGIGLNVKSKTSPTVYGSIEQLEDSFDNGGTSFETILSLSKLSHSIAPDEEAFSKYEPTPKVYWSLKEIKNDNSEMKIWCRNRVGNKASKWIMVSGDGYKANFDVVDSDENGNPTDMKDDTANFETGYGSDYWNNRDNTPQEDYSSTDVKNNLKDLKNNYISLANFFKELFGFLPTEIWIILIGLVSTMAIIAIVVFVRG